MLGTGDTLVLYTDGVTEAFDDQGEMFGDARLAALLESDANDTAPDQLATILDSLERFTAGAPPVGRHHSNRHRRPDRGRARAA
ncbi:MAG: SpoIIE family protein phosphatase [Geminicoccaceae bacterium]